MAHIFISYSRKDTDFVNRIEHVLREVGLNTWRDVHSIPGGAKWFRRIKQGLESSYAMIYIDTTHAEQSDWVEREFLYAASLNLPMIPVKYDSQFMSLQTINLNPVLCDDANFVSGINRIVERLAALSKMPIIKDTVAPSEPDRITDLTAETPSDINLNREIQHYLDWLLVKSKADLRDALYVNLEAQTEVLAQDQSDKLLSFGLDMDFDMGFDRLPLERIQGEEFDKSGETVQDARVPIKDAKRVVLLGEPGSGKTTTLLQLTVDLARAGQADMSAILPVFVPLRQFNGEVDFETFVQSQMYNLQDVYHDIINHQPVIFLFDALNEMPRKSDDDRDLLPEVHAFAKQQPRWVLSCRVRDYQEELKDILNIQKIRLKQLDPPRIRDVILRRFKEQYEPIGIATVEDGENLWKAIHGTDGLLKAWQAYVDTGVSYAFWDKEWHSDVPYGGIHSYSWKKIHTDKRCMMHLCRNPYMTKMVCDIYAIDKSLPENRGALFKKFVDKLLDRDRQAAQAVDASWIDDGLIRKGLALIAYQMHTETEILQTEAVTIIENGLPEVPAELLLRLAQGASLIDIGANINFTHQLLQEYFASEVIVAQIAEGVDSTTYWKLGNWWKLSGWEETLIILAGANDNPEAVSRWIAPAQPEFAIEVLQKSGIGIELSEIDKSTRQTIVDSANDKLTTNNPIGRAAAYRVLGLLNVDKRKGVGNILIRKSQKQYEDDKWLPDIDWVEIPEGDFQFGEVKQTHHLSTFYIARYPITYSQFQTFLDAPDGYHSKKHDWFIGLHPESYHYKIHEQNFKYSNHPRDNVNWYEVVAFCRWLSQNLAKKESLETGVNIDMLNPATWKVRLPTQFEWEKAARGTDGREYPYLGDLDIHKSNIKETNLEMTSAVGIFPDGASPYGVQDMLGNVNEWTFTDFLYPSHDIDSIDISNIHWRIHKGSAFSSYWANIHRNNTLNPYLYKDSLGFRVVSSNPLQL